MEPVVHGFYHQIHLLIGYNHFRWMLDPTNFDCSEQPGDMVDITTVPCLTSHCVIASTVIVLDT